MTGASACAICPRGTRQRGARGHNRRLGFADRSSSRRRGHRSAHPDARRAAGASRVFDRLAIAVLCVVALVALATFRDYGLSWDDYAHSEYGDLLLAFYASGLRDRRALSFVNLYCTAAASTCSPRSPPRFCRSRCSRRAGCRRGGRHSRAVRHLADRPAHRRTARGLLALVLLATCPLYYGHMFMNPKDSPFAVAMAILLLGLVRAFAAISARRSVTTSALVGIGFGLSFGSRIMGAFGAIARCAALALDLRGRGARASGVRPAGARLGRFMLTLVPAVLLAYAVMALVWPWSVVDPLNPFRAIEYFSHFFEKPWQELFGGALISVPDMPRSYVPTLFALKLPEIFFVLGFGGAAGALIAALRRDVAANRRAVLLLLALAALLPLAVTIALRPAMYNGIRHFVFVLPPLAVLGGLAGAWLADAAARRFRFAPVAVAARPGRRHRLAGRRDGAAAPLRVHALQPARRRRARGARPLHARLLGPLLQAGLAGIAGEARRAARDQARRPPLEDRGLRPAPLAAGRARPDFETTWDPQGADFAMMLGEFYCAKLDAPVLAEIVRDGVVYARVYDIRGRSIPTLLTQPGL